MNKSYLVSFRFETYLENQRKIPSIQKRLKRQVRARASSFRTSVALALPTTLRDKLAPMVHFMDMLLLDHLFVRLVFPNRHRISKKAWRSAQPLPYQLKTAKDLGIQTIINLRGNANGTTYRLEKQACQQLGLKFIDYKLRSRDVPSKEELYGLHALFQTVKYPILIHCKSGADRAGLASALYLHWVEGVPLEMARHQLSLRYGHLRNADTGLLDVFLEEYLAFNTRDSMDLLTWVERYYNPKEIKARFKSKGWANRFVYGFLKRE